MSDTSKSKKELITELQMLRAELECAKAHSKKEFPGISDDCRTTLDNLPQIVFELDVDGHLTYVNRLGLKTFGFAQKDIDNGITADDIFPKREA